MGSWSPLLVFVVIIKLDADCLVAIKVISGDTKFLHALGGVRHDVKTVAFYFSIFSFNQVLRDKAIS